MVIFLVCEEVCGQPNIFDDGKNVLNGMDMDDVREASKRSEIVGELEEIVKSWCKKLIEVLKESEQIRRESDSSGR